MCGFLPCGTPPADGRHVSRRGSDHTVWPRVDPRLARPVSHRRARGRSGETGAVEDVRQAAVAARIPGAAALGLVAPASSAVVPATALGDPRWTSEVLRLRSRSLRTRDRRVLATVWWYSASSVLLAPVLAGLATGTPLSARLADLSLTFASDGLPVA